MNLALEDGVVLAEAVRAFGISARALEAFESERRPLTELLHAESVRHFSVLARRLLDPFYLIAEIFRGLERARRSETKTRYQFLTQPAERGALV